MNNNLALKVWKVDYDFIIKNYLDKSLWGKIWNIFTYKDVNFTIQLRAINMMDEYIQFEIKCNKYRSTSNVEYYYNHPEYNINVLKKKINGSIFSLITWWEENIIRDTPEYKQIVITSQDEESALTDIANDFLDKNGVHNEDIRDAYVEKFVSDNNTIDTKLSNYMYYSKYNYLTELMLVFTKATNDGSRYNMVIDAQHNEDKIKEILEYISEKQKQLEDEDFEEYEDNLEDI
jgi:hypothetical protein